MPILTIKKWNASDSRVICSVEKLVSETEDSFQFTAHI